MIARRHANDWFLRPLALGFITTVACSTTNQHAATASGGSSGNGGSATGGGNTSTGGTTSMGGAGGAAGMTVPPVDAGDEVIGRDGQNDAAASTADDTRDATSTADATTFSDASAPADAGYGLPIVLTDDAGWSWFQSPRALIIGTQLVVGSVSAGFGDPTRRGDVEAIVFDLVTQSTTVVELHNALELDDHDSAALLVRPDGRLLAVYGKHDSENHFYYRLSQPSDALHWDAEQTFVPSATTSLTYSNVYRLSGENNRIYDFYRGLDATFKPSYAFSDDLGQTWRSGNVVIAFPSTMLQRPYVRYVSNGTDTIHIVYTDAHPRDFDNSLYHVFYRAGMLYRSDGTAIRALTQGLAMPNEGTRIFQGDPQNVAWIVDAVLDPSQRPVTAYSVQVGSAGLPVGQGGDDIRYRYAQWDGAAWRDHPLAFAGSRLYAGEDDYSGLVAIDPARVSTVYFSTNADPVTNAPLISTADSARHYEIYRGDTADGGATWQFTSVTKNSNVDNLRPLFPAGGDGRTKVLLWLRGRYQAYTNYQQQAVALVWHE